MRYALAVLHLVRHPVVHDCLVQLRDASTPPELFRPLTERISVLLGAEALAGLPQRAVEVITPMGPAGGHRIDVNVVIVPVMRAGLGMLPGVLQLVPQARVGFIGLRRCEETAVAEQYFERLPGRLEDSHVLLMDPMLATGGSALAAIELLKRAGARHLSMVCIVAAPEGVAALEGAHPDVAVFAPVVDRELDARKFIVPGLGDFGDRLYGTV
jgi:uracil phosphoribosyltransferase